MRKGEKMSEEQKAKISASNKGKPKSELHRKNLELAKLGDRNNRWKGGKPNCLICNKSLSDRRHKYCVGHRYLATISYYTPEERERKSKMFKGANSLTWKGGITKTNLIIRQSFHTKNWRNSVLTRDSFSCKKCFIKNDNLVVHHIRNFSDSPELRFEPTNGVTLCKTCHITFHKTYGFRKNTDTQIENYLLCRN